VHHLAAYPLQGRRKNISLCEIVFPSHANKKNVTLQNRHMEKQFFSSTSMGNSWWTRSWPSCLPYSHNPCDGYNLPQWVVLQHSALHLKNYLLLAHCEHSSIRECLSCPFIVLPSKYPDTLVIIWMSPCFSFSFLSLRSCGMLSLFSPTVPQQFIFHCHITA